MQKKLLLLFCSLMLLCIYVTAQSPAYLIDFLEDEPKIDFISPQVTEVTGNVLLNDDAKSQAGFGYKITMTVTGGPTDINETPIDFAYGLRDLATLEYAEAPEWEVKTAASQIDQPGTKIRENFGGPGALSFALQGWLRDTDKEEITYYRDPTTKMTFVLELDNGADLVNLTYELGDMDYIFRDEDAFKSNGDANICFGNTDSEDYACRKTYIDQIRILSGAGSNEYTFDGTRVKQVTDGAANNRQSSSRTDEGDLFYANFPDENNDQKVDIDTDGRIPGVDSDGNITIYNPGNIGKQIIFEYDDPGFALASEGSAFMANTEFHDFDAYNQVMSFLSGMIFDAGLCSLDESMVSAVIQSTTYPNAVLEASIPAAAIPATNSISYQWTSSTTDCDDVASFSTIAGATSATYNATGLTGPIFYRVFGIEKNAAGEEICAIASPCIALGRIQGCITVDDNGDGVVNDANTPIEGVTVSLLSSTGSTVSSINTGADGKYSFVGLPAGDYKVTIGPPEGYKLPFGISELGDLLSSNGVSDNIALAAGGDEEAKIGLCPCMIISHTAATEYIHKGESNCVTITGPEEFVFSPPTDVAAQGGQYCFSPTASTEYIIKSKDRNCDYEAKVLIKIFNEITGCITVDDNGDGVVNDQNTPIEGVSIALVAADGTVLETQTTGPDGKYAFTSVPDGSYTLNVTPGNGYKLPIGNSELGDLLTNNGGSSTIPLAGGQQHDTRIGLCPCVPIVPSETEADIYQEQEFCITLEGPGNYEFDPPTDVLIRANGEVCFSPLETTIYTIRSRDRNCDYEATVEIRVWNEVIPTMSQWGLMIFALLILNMSLIFVFKQEAVLAGAVNIQASRPSLDKSLFIRHFGFVLLSLIVVFGISVVLFSYELMPFDIPGSIISAALLSVFIQLSGVSKNKK